MLPGVGDLTWVCKPKMRASARRIRKNWPRLRLINGSLTVLAEETAGTSDSRLQIGQSRGTTIYAETDMHPG